MISHLFDAQNVALVENQVFDGLYDVAKTV